MLVLGLTGGSGAGKGYVSALLNEVGIEVLDCDAVSRAVCGVGSPCLSEIAAALGEGVLNLDGSYNRSAVAKLVFSDAEKLAILNRITHRHILAECRRWLDDRRRAGAEFAVIDAPVLYESGFDAECDAVIAVLAPLSLRVRRICQRDHIDEDMAKLRISRQKSDEFYRLHADFILENNEEHDAAVLRGEIAIILDCLRKNQNKAKG